MQLTNLKLKKKGKKIDKEIIKYIFRADYNLLLQVVKQFHEEARFLSNKSIFYLIFIYPQPFQHQH